MKNQHLSKNLRAARKAKNLTQKEMSESLKIKLSRYQAWEESRSEPCLEHLTKICDILEVDDMYLFVNKLAKA